MGRSKRYIPTPPPKRKGRPPFVPTDVQRHTVETMVMLDYSQETMAALLKITVNTLIKHFKHEIANGKQEVQQKLGANLVKIGLGDGPQAVAAAKHVLATRFKWIEASRVEHTGADGQPIQIESLTDEQLEHLIRRLDRPGKTPAEDGGN